MPISIDIMKNKVVARELEDLGVRALDAKSLEELLE